MLKGFKFRKSSNVRRWISFYDKYLKRKAKKYGDIRLWVGKSPLKAEVNIGIKIKNPSAKEFNDIYRAINVIIRKKVF